MNMSHPASPNPSHTHAHHGCSHGHHRSPIRSLWIVVTLTAAYMVLEFFGGLWANSLTLIADAGHMLTDVGSLGLALFAAWFTQRPASPQNTYGYHRLEIFAAFINGVLLATLSLFIILEAIERLKHPVISEGSLMTWIALGGLVVNCIAAKVLHQQAEDNLNVRAAYLHVLSDLLGSLSAIFAGICVWLKVLPGADSWFSILIAGLILFNALSLLYEAVHILLEASPAHLNVAQIREALLDLPEVCDIHDLHVWSITKGKDALSAHVVVASQEAYHPDVVKRIQNQLKDQFSISHVTIQLETPDFEEDAIHF